MVLVDGQGLPLGVRLESASPGEATLAEATLQEVRVPRPKGRPRQKPKRVIADRAYDSDPLRERLIEIARAQQPEGGWKRALNIDAEISLAKTTMATLDALAVLEPHGMGNPRPTFIARGAIVQGIRRVGKTHGHDGATPPPGPHLQLRLKDAKNVTWEAIGWRMGERASEVSAGVKVDVVFQLDINEWNGERKLQLVMQDFMSSAV